MLIKEMLLKSHFLKRTLSSQPSTLLLKSLKTKTFLGGLANQEEWGRVAVLHLQHHRGIKTTSTQHPLPVYDNDDKILQKLMDERNEDLPLSMRKQETPSDEKSPYEKPIRKCILCEHNIKPDYKNIKLLSQFVSSFTGLVYPKNITGLCNKKQEELEKEIFFAIKIGWMASYLKEVEFLKDPKICDPDRPHKPHKY